MKFSQMLDNIEYAIGEDSFRSASLFICIGLVLFSIVVALIVGLIEYPAVMIPGIAAAIAAAIIGRIIYAAIKGK